MQLPLQVSFRHMEPSPAMEALVREKAARLDRFASRIMSCRVVIEQSSHRHQQGNHFEVRIDITLPEGEVVAGREPSKHREYRDVEVAIRDAFSAAARQLEDYVRRQRGAVKTASPARR